MNIFPNSELTLACRCAGSGGDEAGDDRCPVRGQDRLGVELDALDRAGAVADGHRDPVGPRRDRQFRRQRGLVDDERVVEGRLEGVRQARQDAVAVVRHRVRLAVDRARRLDHPGAERGADRLGTQADAEQRDARLRAGGHRGDADPRLGRGTGSRRDHHARRPGGDDLGRGHLVVPDDLDARPRGAQEVSEVPGEGVVVVDEDHERRARRGEGGRGRRSHAGGRGRPAGGAEVASGGRPDRVAASAAVTGPGGQARRRVSTAVTGTTPATALVTKTSLAWVSSSSVSGFWPIEMPWARAARSTAARGVPGSRRPSAGGVSSTPSITANTLARSVSSSSPVSSMSSRCWSGPACAWAVSSASSLRSRYLCAPMPRGTVTGRSVTAMASDGWVACDCGTTSTVAWSGPPTGRTVIRSLPDGLVARQRARSAVSDAGSSLP